MTSFLVWHSWLRESLISTYQMPNNADIYLSGNTSAEAVWKLGALTINNCREGREKQCGVSHPQMKGFGQPQARNVEKELTPAPLA
jgi:hypothetical protein